MIRQWSPWPAWLTRSHCPVCSLPLVWRVAGRGPDSWVWCPNLHEFLRSEVEPTPTTTLQLPLWSTEVFCGDRHLLQQGTLRHQA